MTHPTALYFKNMFGSSSSMMQEAAQTVQDAAGQDAAASTAYDSLWAGNGVPTQELSAMEQILLSDDKIFVVLAVVLIIWFGIIILMLRTDSHLKKVEKAVEDRIPADSDDF